MITPVFYQICKVRDGVCPQREDAAQAGLPAPAIIYKVSAELLSAFGSCSICAKCWAMAKYTAQGA